MEKYIQDKYLGLLFGLISFLYFTYNGLTREKIKSDDDLLEIAGKLSSYSFQDGTGRKRMGHEYYLTLDKYSCTFQIKADYLNKFQGYTFMNKVRRGDRVRISIPKRQLEKLKTEEKIHITSLESNNWTYLRKDDVLEIERSFGIMYADYLLGVGFLTLGLLIYRFRKREE